MSPEVERHCTSVEKVIESYRVEAMTACSADMVVSKSRESKDHMREAFDELLVF